MEILKKEFTGKGSQSIFQFRQVERIGNVAIYIKFGLATTYYEVIIIRQQPERVSEIGGELVSFEAKEIYPTDNDFGTYGWSCSTFDRAIEKFKELIEHEANKATSRGTIQNESNNHVTSKRD